VNAKRNVILVVFGRKGSGKSFYVKSKLAGLDRWIVWDPRSEYDQDESGRPSLGARTFRSVGDFLEAVAADGEIGRVVLQCPRWEFGALCEFAMEAGDLTLVVDEIDQHCGSSHAVEGLVEMFRRSRHARVNFIGIAARPAIVPKDLTYASDASVFFQTSEPRDLSYIAEKFGEQVAVQVRALNRERHEHVLVS
jgi:hypothetical protein